MSISITYVEMYNINTEYLCISTYILYIMILLFNIGNLVQSFRKNIPNN